MSRADIYHRVIRALSTADLVEIDDFKAGWYTYDIRDDDENEVVSFHWESEEGHSCGYINAAYLTEAGLDTVQFADNSLTFDDEDNGSITVYFFSKMPMTI